MGTCLYFINCSIYYGILTMYTTSSVVISKYTCEIPNEVIQRTIESEHKHNTHSNIANRIDQLKVSVLWVNTSDYSTIHALN